MKKVLLICFQFPPFSGSSGIQRALSLTRYLPENGWEPLVLTADPRAYPIVADDLLAEVPPATVVTRAFALDASRHLSVGGRYLEFTALPDRWVSWWCAGMLQGLRLARRYRPDVIWASYPIATAFMLGISLSRRSGIPLVADFRDAMVVADYPQGQLVRNIYSKIEAAVVRHAAVSTFTTPQSRDMYADRYAGQPAGKLVCIRNGFDESSFARAEAGIRDRQIPKRRLRLVHSGLLKVNERDPRPFFKALADLIREGRMDRQSTEVLLRAPGSDEELYREHLAILGLTDVVRIEPAVTYLSALQEMLEADALLVWQDAGCNHLVPAKLYEYIRAGRPVFAMTDSEGETAALLREAGVGTIADLTDVPAIKDKLCEFLTRVRRDTEPVAKAAVMARYSRRSQVREFAGIFNRVSDGSVIP